MALRDPTSGSPLSVVKGKKPEAILDHSLLLPQRSLRGMESKNRGTIGSIVGPDTNRMALNWIKRWPEWSAVTNRYLEQRGPLTAWHLLKAIWAGPVPRAVWRQRILRGCNGCICFDREINIHPDLRRWKANACAGPHGTGCGCWVPTVALSANPNGNGCWMHTINEGHGGWPAYKFPTIWHRLWASIGFLLGR